MERFENINNNLKNVVVEKPQYEPYDPNIRKKVAIPKEMTIKKTMEEYHVSRATAFRAKERGWLFMNEKKREINVDNNWIEKNRGKIEECARKAAKFAMKKFQISNQDLAPYDFEDILAEAKLRILQLSGNDNRKSDDWLISAGINSALEFIKTKIFSPKKFEKNNLEEYINYSHTNNK
ncbi:MAG TPA: hypothetical protein PLD95_04500 [bacterium]|jgi:hypothetical protein|nr:hypothetical protein [bacterium]HOG38695.1 hypothetical protein [bacterium]HQI03549.1 hypothetical protein [bacterium]